MRAAVAGAEYSAGITASRSRRKARCEPGESRGAMSTATAPAGSDSGAPGAAVDRFVIPELCSAMALAAVFIAAELLAIVITLVSDSTSWVRFALVSLFVQWCAIGSAGVLCLARGYLGRLPIVSGALAAWLLVSLVIVLFTLIGELAVSGNFSAGVRELLGMMPPLLVTELDWNRVLRIVVCGMVLAGMLLRYLYVQQNLRSREQSELRLRLQALQSRIRPHFLFNSMNIIASLIETDPETAETVVEDLSELFRASLNEAGQQVPLQTELDLCDRYVRIETLRLGDRLQIEWEMDPIPHGVQIPLLTLQPLIENAIYHGIQPLPEGGLIHVRVHIEDGEVEIMLTNPLPPGGGGHSSGNRMALTNIRSRLAVLYGDRAALEAGPEAALAAADGEPGAEFDGGRGAAGERFVTRLRYPVDDGVVPSADEVSARVRRKG